jgi:hypothetical protein
MNSDDYSKKQTKRDAQYEREYEAWVKSMTIDERREAEKLGLLKPCVQRSGNGAASRDSADSPIMRIGDDPALEVHEPEAKPETATRDAIEALRHFVADLVAEGNTRLTVECLAVALGLSAYNGESMTAIANRHGIFGVESYREVFAFDRFWAIGSGRRFALGAMHASWSFAKTAREVATAGVAAGCEFDTSSAGPVRMQTFTLTT